MYGTGRRPAPACVGGDFNCEPSSDPIKNLTNNNFVVLNEPDIKTTPTENPVSLKDMIIGYKKYSTEHNIISRGIPVFPREDWKVNKKTSDHLPYFVTIKL